MVEYRNGLHEIEEFDWKIIAKIVYEMKLFFEIPIDHINTQI